MHRSGLVLLVILVLVGLLNGCADDGTGSATREGERIIADSMSQPALPVTTDNLLGEWETPGPFEQDIPTRVVLDFQVDGVGTAWSYMDFEGPGLSAPSPFTYELAGERVQLRFEDGHSEAFVIDELKANLFMSSVEGTATWARTSTWTRRTE